MDLTSSAIRQRHIAWPPPRLHTEPSDWTDTLEPEAHGGWRLIREIGLDYASPAGEIGLDLICPIAAERSPDGSRLIVDDPEASGRVPIRLQCRTVFLSSDLRVIFDTQAAGIHDGYGCLVRDGCVALLRRTRWDVLLLTATGKLCQRIDLSTVSKLTPRLMCWTGRSLLVVFLSQPHELSLVEMDLDGRLLWSLPQAGKCLGVPGSMQLLRSGAILVADEFRHTVQEIRRDGSHLVRWGEWAHPARDLRHLSGPKCARQSLTGELLIADTNNHRLLVIEPNGSVHEHRLQEPSLVAPSYAQRLDDGGLLVCDGGNRAVWELSNSGGVRWQAGDARIRRRWLSFPRSVQFLGHDRYLVADTAANRLLEAGPQGLRIQPVQGSPALFWPRSAYRTASGTTLVADGRHSRVLEVNDDGRVLWTLRHVSYKGQTWALDDPHDVRPLPDGRLLIVDSAQHLVVATTRDGDADWLLGPDSPIGLSDPHNAQPLEDGRVVISDPGNHRILIADPSNESVQIVATLHGPTGLFCLHQPRYAELGTNGTLVIVDTGNNRVLACDPTGRLIWDLSFVPDSPIPSLAYPRWASFVGSDELLVCDHLNHRIVHLQRI